MAEMSMKKTLWKKTGLNIMESDWQNKYLYGRSKLCSGFF